MILWVSILAIGVAFVTPVVRSVAHIQAFFRVHGQVRDKIRSLAVRCPPDVSSDKWQRAVDWTANLISQEYPAPSDKDRDSLRELNDGLAEKIKGNVDLTTLQWVWDQCEKKPKTLGGICHPIPQHPTLDQGADHRQ